MLFFIFFTLKIHTVSVCLFTKEQYACTYGEGKVNFRGWIHTVSGYSYFVGLSKNGLFDEAEMAMPTVIWTSLPRNWSSSAATPIEYMMRVSRRRSAAVAHADPSAMPTSMLFITQGTSAGTSAHEGNPQCPQLSDIG